MTAVLQPAVVTFAAKQVETAMLEYDRNPWVKKLANRGAQMEMTWSGREQVMLPYSSMPASACSGAEERINWMLAFCQWNEPEMEKLVKQLQEALLPLKRQKEAALQVQRDAVHALHAALHQMPDEHANALSAAVCSKTFCATPSELPSLLLNDRWLDHAVSLEHNSSLPAPRGLGSREILQWACTLQPHHITSSWLHDGASPFSIAWAAKKGAFMLSACYVKLQGLVVPKQHTRTVCARTIRSCPHRIHTHAHTRTRAHIRKRAGTGKGRG